MAHANSTVMTYMWYEGRMQVRRLGQSMDKRQRGWRRWTVRIAVYGDKIMKFITLLTLKTNFNIKRNKKTSVLSTKNIPLNLSRLILGQEGLLEMEGLKGDPDHLHYTTVTWGIRCWRSLLFADSALTSGNYWSILELKAIPFCVLPNTVFVSISFFTGYGSFDIQYSL